MLVITRKKGESFLIGDEIEITVLEQQGDKVKIGIAAPRALPVLRKELLQEATDFNREAAGVSADLQSLAAALGDISSLPPEGKPS
ncbi:carbon storage regulator [Ethanoligenens harbinense]|uniref:Translational regulator CsrA n=1 Tax=Ethanoligenens harbinense (strain DSM 18485 / JCM 12961 / CGMCC 1.5033 / YUAN-3) TaxID=663278 RepID=E6U6H2_ETHHY|nr:carbon storage regulator [Ethanoligenens harbinense]ADU28042.1 carbon storage regulator, CsrA [Ethanoligenens harbinense YUAN-3]AVQ97059.1 carbon storage regulator [Ethanoligenens harbinense YUAN-3]AYF39721.1 carbon storage regulator [Ethanoligenens harbinense]AYF42554.1 carbon storage regulator [Ethanoligenens harbinense]QCN93302.1 carbon storage regulator [Ethanoligenens harbinense]